LTTDGSTQFIVTYSLLNQTISWIGTGNTGSTWTSPKNMVADGAISDLSLNTNLYMTDSGNVTLIYTSNGGTVPWRVNFCGSNTSETTGNDVCNVKAYYFVPGLS
jgi:hypothetical protein